MATRARKKTQPKRNFEMHARVCLWLALIAGAAVLFLLAVPTKTVEDMEGVTVLDTILKDSLPCIRELVVVSPHDSICHLSVKLAVHPRSKFFVVPDVVRQLAEPRFTGNIFSFKHPERVKLSPADTLRITFVSDTETVSFEPGLSKRISAQRPAKVVMAGFLPVRRVRQDDWILYLAAFGIVVGTLSNLLKDHSGP